MQQVLDGVSCNYCYWKCMISGKGRKNGEEMEFTPNEWKVEFNICSFGKCCQSKLSIRGKEKDGH
jgi:hypothetical protein